MKILFFLIIFYLLGKIHLSPDDCGSSEPENVEDCFLNKIQYEKNVCCFLENENERICKLFGRLNISDIQSSIIYNNKNYTINCNHDISNLNIFGTICGGQNITINECLKNSLPANKCCYYSSNITNLNQCFWLGEYYSIKNYIFVNKDNVTITCSAKLVCYPLFNILRCFNLKTIYFYVIILILIIL